MKHFKKLFVIIAVIASIFVAVGCSSTQSATPSGQVGQPSVQVTPQGQTGQEQQPVQQASYQDIDAAQAKQLIDTDKTVQLIDVREPDEFATGHIDGAKLIPVGELASRLGEIDKTKPVLVYCLSGARSAQAAQVLVQSGYAKVYNLAGGIESWTYPVVK